MLVALLLRSTPSSFARAAPIQRLSLRLNDSTEASTTSNTCEGNDCRTMLGMLWACLITIFACTWTAVHPNLPPPGASTWKVLKIRLKLVLLGLIAPEYILFWAIEQRRVAKLIVRAANKHITKQKWTLAHGFFALMGGLVIEIPESQPQVVVPGLYGMGFKSFEITPVTKEEIQDRSKSDALSKVIVLGQLAWFLSQCIARAAFHLPITELELVTAAYSALAVLIYFVWWEKPMDVACAIPIKCVDDTERTRILGLINDSSIPRRRISEFLQNTISLNRSPAVPTLFSGGKDLRKVAEKTYSLVYEYAIGVVFGAIHCIGWNFPFSSQAEQNMWRICAAAITVYTTFGFLVALSLRTVPSTTPGYRVLWWLFDILTIIPGPFPYVVFRLILIVLPFAALRNLPALAYRTVEWTNYIPHFGS